MSKGTKTYTALILILFFKNFNTKEVPCTRDLITMTDMLANHFNLRINISLQTKYSIVRELIDSDVLSCNSVEGFRSLELEKRIREYILTNQVVNEKESADIEDD